MQIAEAFVKVRADTSDAEDAIEKNIPRAGRSAAGDLAKVFGGAAILAGIKGTIDAASDLNETINITGIVFGDASGEIQAFAKGAAQSLGLSERAALGATTAFGNMLTNLGFGRQEVTSLSQSLTGLAVDLGSAFNRSNEDAISAITAALRGENEQIESFGVFLNEAVIRQEALRLGLGDTTGAIDQNAKAQATLSIITQQTARFTGDFANTADSAANAEKRAAAEAENSAASLGQNLLPVYERAVDLIGTLAGVFADLPAPVQTGILALAGIVALAGPISTVGNLMKELGASNINFGRSAAVVAGAVGLLTAVLVAHQQGQARARAEIDRYKAAIDGATESIDVAIRKEAAATLTTGQFADTIERAGVDAADLATAVGDTTTDFDAYREAVVAARGDQEALRDLLRDSGLATTDLGRSVLALTGEYEGQTQVTTGVLDRLQEMQGRIRTATEETNALEDATRKIESAQKGAGDQATLTAEEQKALTAEIDKQEQALRDLIDATLAAASSQLGLEDASDRTEDAVAAFTEAAAKADATDEGLARAANDAYQAMLGQAGAAVKLAEDQAKATGASLSAQQALAVQRAELERIAGTLAPGSPLRAQLQAYIDQLERIPTQVSTTVTTRFVQQGAGFTQGNIRGAQHGFAGTVTEPTLFLTGEGGQPEDVLVVPHSQGGIRSGGGGVNIENAYFGDTGVVADLDWFARTRMAGV